MYDLSKEFNKFHNDHVALSSEVQSELYEKKNNNVKWLKAGLKEHNLDNGTSYKIAEIVIQGSIAMHTAVQNDSNDYDIDVAIIMDKSSIGDLGPIAVKNVVVDALKRKCPAYKDEPEAKTNCVRIYYADGYHIDFAIYRRWKDSAGEYQYEHAGSEWRQRDPKAINDWFKDSVKSKGSDLRKTVRLLKMFAKSRESWQMPGGLVLSVLCSELLSKYDRLDETFYYTIKGIRDRLRFNRDVTNPADKTKSLILTEKHRQEINNLYSRLDSYIGKLSPLFDNDCTESTARSLWYEFFNHDFWEKKPVSESLSIMSTQSSLPAVWNNTEEYVEDKFSTVDRYNVHISCLAKGDGYSVPRPLSYFEKRVPKNLSLTFSVDSCDVPEPYEIWWKILNVGTEAKRRNDIRGQIVKGNRKKVERTIFPGPHYAECYIVKNGICVARDRINVPIG